MSLIGSWKNSRSKSTAVHRLGRSHTKREEYPIEEANISNKWLMFWRRIGGGKKKISGDPASFYAQKRYDPESYLLNFDEGLGRIEQDNFYRSFSVKYADSSRLFHAVN